MEIVLIGVVKASILYNLYNIYYYIISTYIRLLYKVIHSRDQNHEEKQKVGQIYKRVD